MQSILVILPSLKVTQEQFELLAAANRDVRLERSLNGELIIMPQVAPVICDRVLFLVRKK